MNRSVVACFGLKYSRAGELGETAVDHKKLKKIIVKDNKKYLMLLLSHHISSY